MRDAAPYQPPPNLTAHGRQTFDQSVAGYARALHSELERLADDRHGDPEYRYTHGDVLTAKASYEQGLRPDHGADPQYSLLSAILVTIGSVGASIMAQFLHSEWQIALFVVLLVIGLIGLALTWVGGTRAKRGSPPRDRAPAGSRMDG